VEVQVLGDQRGNMVALGERECSVQRRHQKLIEESPSPAVEAALRERLCDAALRAARAASYTNAGTVEFLLDAKGEFYFLEVNARIQVEHPVTEQVTGLDLIREQLRLAWGEPLGYRQEDVVLRGHAIECRISAEDPRNQFLPSVGRLEAVQEPGGPGVRVDSGVAVGIEVSLHYDPLLAKLITWGGDRQQACRRMARALDELLVLGVQTTTGFHRYVLRHPDFLEGRLDTGFIDRIWGGAGQPPDEKVVRQAAIVAALAADQRRPLTVPENGLPADGDAWRLAGRRARLGAV
jgi:acetyl/propionyl-CoA carboxylase alpha subunit